MAPGDTLQGRRLPDGQHYKDAEPGDYWRQQWGSDKWEWTIRDPKGNLGTIRQHEVTEHEDGTITVSPSILDERPGDPGAGYHGFLERGVWREV